MVEMEVEGRHALLFDDDAMAAFVNSPQALLQWNSLLIDRYDVRHLLHDVPPPSKKRRASPLPEPDGVSLSDLDRERYHDLPPDGDDDIRLRETNGQELEASDNYQAVAFSYGDTGASIETRSSNPGLGYSGFHPPFPLPESLLKNLIVVNTSPSLTIMIVLGKYVALRFTMSKFQMLGAEMKF